MGIFLCCFDGLVDDKHGDANDHEEIRELNSPTEGDDLIEIVAMETKDEKGFVNHSQVEPEREPKPEPVLESKMLIPRESMLPDDYVLSRDDECPICLEEYDSENPRIITNCSHHWHLSCIYEWQKRSARCPICKELTEFEEMK